MRWIKKIVFFFFVVGAIYSLQKFCHKQTDGFAICKIRKAFSCQKNEDHSSLLTEEEQLVKSILSQPLSYIGRGGQCYAFASQDGKYTVKLLKYNNNYPRIWFRLFPFPGRLEKYRQKKLASKARKLAGEYTSYDIAKRELQQETGIVYFHLHQKTLPSTLIQIQDKLGIFHTLQADDYQFYIQKKGSSFYAGIQQLLSSKGIESAKTFLDEFVHYLFSRCQKKITDGDDGIWRNFAIIEGRPFQIDIGQFSYKQSLSSIEEQKKDLLFFTQDFHYWLTTISPPLAEHLIHQIQSVECEIKP